PPPVGATLGMRARHQHAPAGARRSVPSLELVAAPRRVDVARREAPSLLGCHSPHDQLALCNLLTDSLELLRTPLLLA
ncbi:MAG TPA: hypothetical protein VGY54_21905, partial [Polyangiaceae bacterium]|nr:hypothetical protein [Polyangiaceae bacterium]